MDNESTNSNIVLFLIFAFGLPLICVLLFQNFDIFQVGIMSFIINGLEAMTPTLAALITVAIMSGSVGLRAFVKRCYMNNLNIWFIILAVMLPAMVLTIARLTSLIFLEGIPFSTGITEKKLIVIMWALVAEELGWRGFLQEKLDKHCGDIVTPLLVGSIWTLWHYHFFWLGSMSAPLILFFMGCISDSFGYYWITKKSKGNIVPACLWHFTGNLFFNIYIISPEYNKGSIIPYVVFIVYSIIMAISISVWGNSSIKKDRSIDC
jgi:membrane protease YdiL (CAAX protease family)